MNEAMTLSNPGGASRDTRLVLKMLEPLRGGPLAVRLPGGAVHLFGEGEHPVTLQVHDEALFTRVLTRGDIGLAETWLDGLWSTSDLTSLLTLLARNREALRGAVYGRWHRLLAARALHWLNRNSRSGSRRNIMSHYDLGNDFYRLWLDDSMSYSSALFNDPAQPLAQAQQAKYHRMLERLAARPGQDLLEIGCGWGGFAALATQAGLQVTGLTLSPAQLEWARARVPGADLRLQDYRDVQGQFHHVVSIEMFEAVGERWWPSYFGTVARALKPGGRAMIQSITIRDDLFPTYRRGTDFIQQYIFPGGMLPSRSAFRRAAGRAGLVVCNELAFGADYARTLAEWQNAFERNWSQIAALGFDERFRRLWRFYLSYCEAGFLAGNIDVVQFELAHHAA